MNNDWIIWNGGECPVSPDTIVQAQWADEDRFEAEESEERPANAVRWAWNSKNNIIAYRIIPGPLWAELTVRVSDFGKVWVDDLDELEGFRSQLAASNRLTTDLMQAIQRRKAQIARQHR